TGLGIVLEERVQVGIRCPQIFSFPTNPVRTVGGSGELRLDHPALGIDAIDLARRRHRGPELAVSPLLPMRACAERLPSQHLSLLKTTDGLALLLRRPSGCGTRARLRERTAACRRVAQHLVNH